MTDPKQSALVIIRTPAGRLSSEWLSPAALALLLDEKAVGAPYQQPAPPPRSANPSADEPTTSAH